MDTLLQDLRYAVRSLMRRPGFTFAAVACLGLGIGASTAAFSVVHGILYRTLPFEDANRIVSVEAVSEARGVAEGGLTWADIGDLRGTSVFEDVAGVLTRSVTLTGGDAAERVQAAAVTPNTFGLLGVEPARGRDFRPGDAAPAGFEEVVILSQALWQGRFGGAEDIVGRAVGINGRNLVVVGVMPPSFAFPANQDLWLPLGSTSATERAGRSFWGVGRLAGGVAPATAAVRLGGLSDRLADDYPETHRGWTFGVRPFRDVFVHPMARQLLQLMFAAVGFVLLIACANVANLLLVRGLEREGELAIRSAVGASRGRVVRQLLTEALVLGLVGAAVGWLTALWAVEWLTGRIPEDMAYWMRVETDGTALLFTLGLALVTSALFGALPAVRASSSAGASGIGRRLRSGSGGSSLRGALVTGEIALCLVLLVGAGLMIRSFLQLDVASPGFDPAPVQSFRMVLAGDRYDPMGAKADFFQTAAERLAALPGVRGAVATSSIPADDGGPLVGVFTREETPPEERVSATLVVSTAGLFGALGEELLAGREITPAEARDTAADVALVGASLARRLFPGPTGERAPPTGAVDARIHLEGRGWFRVVGVAPDLQYEEFGEETAGSRLQVHLPHGVSGWRGMAFLVRAAGEPAGVTGGVRSELADMDPDLALWDVMSMQERLRLTTWPQRFFAFLFVGYGVVALVLALTGVYGLIAYEVSRRRREIGVRMALGASTAEVTRQVVIRAGRMALAGTAVGVVGAALLSRGMRGVLYGVGETDLPTFVGAGLFMIAAALLAGYFPARRVARLQPGDAIRLDSA